MHKPNIPFLATKFQPPRRVRGVIARPRLEPLLADGRERLLTLIKAPPGSGKTTLALAWSDELAAQGARVAWFSIDAEDDEPDRFLLYVAAALHKACPAVGKVSEDLGNAPLLSAGLLTTMLVNELAAQTDEIFLFLDDYHLITREAIHGHVAQLLRHAPEHFHVVLLGRAEPPLPLAAYRARDELLEIDAGALRFDAEETAQLVRKAGHGELPADEVRALNTLTDGWVAALRAVMLSLREQRDAERYLRKLSGLSRPISGLFAELLDQLPGELVDFMLRVSVVDRISGTLAEALSGRGDGQAMLDRLERQQLFLAVLDADGLWFAFHPLFRDYLQRRLQGNLGGAAVSELHRRAAGWYATRELWAEAVRHALAAGDSEQALVWIDQCAMRLVEGGDVFTLLSWERQLHSYVLQSPCRLRLALAWGLGLGMAVEEALRLLGGVEAELESQDGAEAAAMRAECLALRAMMTVFADDCETAGRLAEACLALGGCDGWVSNVVWNIVAAGHLFARRWERLYATPSVVPGVQAGGRYLVTSVYRLSILGSAEFAQGHLDRAAEYFEEALQTGAAAGQRVSMLTALPAFKLAQVRYEQERGEEAFALYAEHREAIGLVAAVDSVIGAYRVALAAARVAGDAQRMRGLFDEVERLSGARRWYRLEAALLLERVRVSLTDGRLAEASGCVQRLEALVAATAEQPGAAKVDIARDAALARGWLRLGEGAYARAIAELTPQWAMVCAAAHVVEQVRLGTALAQAYLGRGDEARAREVFAEVCRLAAQSGALRPIIDQPLAVAPLFALLGDALPAALLPLAARVSHAVAGVPAAQKADAAPSLETLSPREQHILKLLAGGNSNKEIARALGIGPETVKSHLKKVYAKLHVDNRAQAAARAQSMALVDQP